MNRKLKFLLTSQAFLILMVSRYFFIKPDFSKQIKTNSFETKQIQKVKKHLQFTTFKIQIKTPNQFYIQFTITLKTIKLQKLCF